MNKARVNELIPRFVEKLKSVGIVNERNEIVKTYRGQISTFGAAVSGGSLLAAVAFFSDDGEGDVERSKLMQAIYEVLAEEKNDSDVKGSEKSLYRYVEKYGEACKEDILNAAIALKLAMNVYTLKG